MFRLTFMSRQRNAMFCVYVNLPIVNSFTMCNTRSNGKWLETRVVFVIHFWYMTNSFNHRNQQQTNDTWFIDWAWNNYTCTRVIQKIRGQCRSPSNYLSEIQNQYIIFCKNIYSMNVWIFIAIGQMDLILINFKTNMFCTHGAIVTSKTTSKQYISQAFKIASLHLTQNLMRLTHKLTRPDLLGFLKNDGMEIAKNSSKKCSPCL
jgi:hypothetical protein